MVRLLKLVSVSLDHVWCLGHNVRHLLLLIEIVLLIPAPFLDEVVDNKLYAPAGLLVDFVDDRENLFLLGSGDDAFACMVDGAQGYAGNATGELSNCTWQRLDFELTDL